MHDVTGSALVTRLDLPANDLITKAEKVVEDRHMAKDMSTGPGTTTKVFSEDTDQAKVVSSLDPGPEEHDIPETSNKDDENVVTEQSSQCAEIPETPQPVTPDQIKATDPCTNSVENVHETKETTNKDNEAELPSNVGSTPASAPPKVKRNLDNHMFKSNSRPNRGRIVSLDRAREITDADGYPSSDASPLTDDERRRRHFGDRNPSNRNDSAAAKDDNYGADSSDDDSSYFATHLPSPKSGRSFSYSSTGSAPARTSNYYQNNINRESDASLSFSDESDDDLHHSVGVHVSPMIPPKAGVAADMHLYPQRITRMHSVSSLVSSASSEEGRPHEARRKSMGSTSSHVSTGTSSDRSVRAELHHVVAPAEARPSSHQSDNASGRRSPIMGQQASNNSFYLGSPSPGMLKTSPPTIMQGYAPPPGMPHPQPQTMTSDQMVAWVSAGNAAAQLYQPSQQAPQVGYGSTIAISQQGQLSIPHQLPVAGGGFRNFSDQTNQSLPFVYSEDDDTDESHLVNKASGGARQASGGVGQQGNNFFAQGNAEQTPLPSRAGGGFDDVNGMQNVAANQVAASGGTGGVPDKVVSAREPGSKGFKVYWRRWVMLLYMSVLNLLSDWTCYSVAPIALWTQEAFGDVDAERLVVIFLGANAVASACEPIVLARLGLRRTVLFGALLLMIGSIVKSGGVPPIIESDLVKGHEEWRLYFGFFLVGLSQPLYQCTPALLSASWFPEAERTMATGVALNANQLGIGFAFIFGTLLVSNSDDIPSYFGLLSLISTIAFMGTLIQFDDAPPTPPSDTARVMRGSLEVNLPSIDTIFQSVRGFGGGIPPPNSDLGGLATAASPSPAAATHAVGQAGNEAASFQHSRPGGSRQRHESKTKRSSRTSSGRKGTSTRRRAGASRSQTVNADSGFRTGGGLAAAPSPARSGTSSDVQLDIALLQQEAERFGSIAPSPARPGAVGQSDVPQNQGEEDSSPLYEDVGYQQEQLLNNPTQTGEHALPAGQPHMGIPPGAPGVPPQGTIPGGVPPFAAFPHPHYQYPYWDPRFQQQIQQQQAYYQQQYYYYHQQAPQPPQPYYYALPYPPHLQNYESPERALPPVGGIDEGAEPIVTFTPHHLDIDIRDDQVLLSIRACLSRPGFIHALVSFTVSGIVINTLSTFMDYLVRLNGAPRAYTGIIGGTFQFVIMISSLIIGKQTDKTRAYYSVTIGMLVLGAFGLAECGVSLDADRGSELRWALVIVAALVGPLQPVSTELGVDVAYPLSENTVLVIQQLFSNLLSALFIPFFKAVKDVGTEPTDDSDMLERPEYTFSFYLLIVLHAAATVFFATFNGRYLRYEHELQKKADEERKAMEATPAFHPFRDDQGEYDAYENERQPLVSQQAV